MGAEAVVGVIGGGQLCRMMAQAVKRANLPLTLIALEATRNCPARGEAYDLIEGDVKDSRQIRKLADISDVLTYELEWTDVPTLKNLEKSGKTVHPSPDTLGIIQDKYTQAKFLRNNKLPVPDFCQVDNEEDARQAGMALGFPFMVKSRRDSYDGKGNYLVQNPKDIEDAVRHFKGRPLMAQRFVRFACEVSVIAARNIKGEIAAYDVGENKHENNILHTTLVPARISPPCAERAKEVAGNVLDALKGAGVFGIEMFVEKELLDFLFPCGFIENA